VHSRKAGLEVSQRNLLMKTSFSAWSVSINNRRHNKHLETLNLDREQLKNELILKDLKNKELSDVLAEASEELDKFNDLLDKDMSGLVIRGRLRASLIRAGALT